MRELSEAFVGWLKFISIRVHSPAKTFQDCQNRRKCQKLEIELLFSDHRITRSFPLFSASPRLRGENILISVHQRKSAAKDFRFTI
jgi:hypothetical protein